MMRRLGRVAAAVLGAGLLGAGLLGAGLLGGCGAADGRSTRSGGDRTLVVLAASSLTESFQGLATRFEADHPGVRVRLVLESSATLATQVSEGAPGDVLATADAATMSGVLAGGHADAADVFATNRLVLVTPADNPARVEGFTDLERADVAWVACIETAPCGALAAELLERGGISADPRSLEVDVKAVLAKVVADEADAGLVYATDARSAGSAVQTFPVPGAEDALNTYEIAVVDQADEPDLAGDWVDLVLAQAGQQALTGAGFGPPAAGAEGHVEAP